MESTTTMKAWEGKRFCRICRKVILVGQLRYRRSMITYAYYAHEQCRTAQLESSKVAPSGRKGGVNE